MRKLLILSLLFFKLCAESSFGYVSYGYTTGNIGDDIQAIAAKRFLPENSIPIQRDWISTFSSPQKVKTIVSGWFMHTKDYWYNSYAKPPEVSWPPSDCIDPLLISIHIIPRLYPLFFSEKSLKYLREHGPVGARDLQTFHELEKRNVPCYYSGCLTLTLNNPYEGQKREEIIYAVDISEAAYKYIRSIVPKSIKVIKVSHCSESFYQMSGESKLKYAETLLNKYARAKCVVTSRLHASLPCLALKTPILFLGSMGDPRMTGIEKIVYHCTEAEFLSGNFNYDLNNPPENSKDYLPIRENLIKIVTEWVQRNSNP